MISNKINKGLKGEPNIPGDKSISHRSIIIPSISNGKTIVKNLLKSQDVLHTINAFKLMGVKINFNDEIVEIFGNGLRSLSIPKNEIYLGNSGTSARLLIGLLASQKFESIVTGDKSLSSRPMKRITDPLKKMKAKIQTTDGKLPINIYGKDLSGCNLDIKIPSAQIKSGLLLAALSAEGTTEITEHHTTRDHTEIMLEAFGADIEINNDKSKKIIKIKGGKELNSKDISVPCDLSSSAFFIVAALINKESKLLLKDININPTRNGILIALEKMGANISYLNKRTNNKEIICDILVSSSSLKGCELDENIAKLMIDEYPILSVAACFANSPSIFRGLGELRVKESDRLNLIYKNLNKCGVDCKIIGDDLHINPSTNYIVKDNMIQTDFDHRIAMSFAIMGTKVGPLVISEAESIETSFPTFSNEFLNIGGLLS